MRAELPGNSVMADPARALPNSGINIVRTDNDGFIITAVYVMSPPPTFGPHAQPQQSRKTFVAQTFSEVFDLLRAELPKICGQCSE
jgi:hypothetical protein